jgi:sulfite exporter TauE/SafE
MNLFIAFLTGLTAGGLGCLAVQGGLMASTLAHQLELDRQIPRTRGDTDMDRKFQPRFALPISLFLLAKLCAYTLLGLLLGTFGSILQFTPLARAALMIAIGIFMLANGLRMLNAHPVFRRFIIEPPSSLTRFIRRTSKNGTSLTTPIVLGALTVLLPCGVAQAIMAAALGSGDPLQGAGLMFAFTLGTMPLFFSAAYCASRLGAVLERFFTRIVALILIALGVISVVYGCNLAGVPLSFPGWMNRLMITSGSRDTSPLAGAADMERQRTYTVSVSNSGYSPGVLHLPANRPVTLIWVTGGSACCARSLVVPALDYQAILPASGKVPLIIPAQKKGTVIHYSCSTGSRTGRLVFDLI